MAGIEKICEYSSDYEGWKMYPCKRNHIQVLSKYRHLFRGADAVLHVFKPTNVWVFKYGMRHVNEFAWKQYNLWTDQKVSYDYYIKHYKELEQPYGGRMSTEYEFVLEVKNPELQGRVEGHYMNWTLNMRQTKKRLIRMLKAYNGKLKIIKHQETYHDYRLNQYKNK